MKPVYVNMSLHSHVNSKMFSWSGIYHPYDILVSWKIISVSHTFREHNHSIYHGPVGNVRKYCLRLEHVAENIVAVYEVWLLKNDGLVSTQHNVSKYFVSKSFLLGFILYINKMKAKIEQLSHACKLKKTALFILTQLRNKHNMPIPYISTKLMMFWSCFPSSFHYQTNSVL